MLAEDLKSYIAALTLEDDGTTRVIVAHSETAYAQYSAIGDTITPLVLVRDFPRIAEIDLDFVVSILSEMKWVPRLREVFVTPSYASALLAARLELGTPIERLNALIKGGTITKLLIPDTSFMITDSTLLANKEEEDKVIAPRWSDYDVPEILDRPKTTGVTVMPSFTAAGENETELEGFDKDITDDE